MTFRHLPALFPEQVFIICHDPDHQKSRKLIETALRIILIQYGIIVISHKFIPGKVQQMGFAVLIRHPVTADIYITEIILIQLHLGVLGAVWPVINIPFKGDVREFLFQSGHKLRPPLLAALSQTQGV